VKNKGKNRECSATTVPSVGRRGDLVVFCLPFFSLPYLAVVHASVLMFFLAY